MKSVAELKVPDSSRCREIDDEEQFFEVIKKEEPTLALLFTNPQFPYPILQREALATIKWLCKKFTGINVIWGYTDSMPGLKKLNLGIYRPVYLFFDRGGALIYRISGYTLTEMELEALLKRLFFKG